MAHAGTTAGNNTGEKIKQGEVVTAICVIGLMKVTSLLFFFYVNL